MPAINVSQALYDNLLQLAQAEGTSIEDVLEQRLSSRTNDTHNLAQMLDTRDAVPYMLYIYDLNLGSNTYVNRYVRNFFDKTWDEIQELGGELYIGRMHPDDLHKLAEFDAHWDVATDSDIFIQEYRMRRADGEYRWLRSYEAVLDRDGSGTPTQIIGTAIDITDEKQSELDNAELLGQLQLALQTANMGMWTLDVATGTLAWDATLHEIYGVSPEQFTPTIETWFELVHPDDRAEAQATYETAMSGGTVVDFHFRIVRPDGEQRYINGSAMGLRDGDGQITRLIGINQDMTDYEQSRRDLAASEARYRTVAANFPRGMVALYDHDLRYTLMDGQGLQDIGMTPADFEGKRLRDVLPPEVYERDEPALLAALRGETNTSVVPFSDEYFKVTTLPVEDEQGNIISGMVISQNVTELKQAEVQQRELNSQLQLAIKSAKLGIWQLDVATGYADWNDELLNMYGLSAETFNNDIASWRERVHPDDRVNAEKRLTNVNHGNDVVDVRYRIIRPDGNVRYISGSGAALHDADGNVSKIISINLDVTDYEQSKIELAASEARYRVLFDGSVNPVIIFDADANIVMVNKTSAQLFGTTAAQIVGRSLGDFYPKELDRAIEHFKKVLAEQKPLFIDDQVQVGPGQRWFSSILQPAPDEHGTMRYIQAIAYDVTDRKKAEQLEARRAELAHQLAQEQALAQERARMFSVLVHEFRNPLTIIRSSSDLLQNYAEHLSPTSRERKLAAINAQVNQLDEMLDEISLLSKATSGFLQYHPQLTDVHWLCTSLIDELRDMATDQHTITFTLITTDRHVMLDEKLMHRALANLVTNAIKYSPNGGRIRLRVAQTETEWLFSVRDEGIGIPANEISSLFQPFKRAGNVGHIRGTGLGLSIVKEIAQKHGGSVAVQSELGMGSTFTISLPI